MWLNDPLLLVLSPVLHPVAAFIVFIAEFLLIFSLVESTKAIYAGYDHLVDLDFSILRKAWVEIQEDFNRDSDRDSDRNFARCGRALTKTLQALAEMLDTPKDSPNVQINLLRGSPNADLLPASILGEAASQVLGSKAIYTDALSYGPDPGYEPLRESIARWLSGFYEPSKGDIEAKRICITGGASQNLGCMLNVFTDPEYTRNIWIVAPAYFLAFRIFEDAGFAGKMRAVPEDEAGLDIEYLRKEIERSEQKAQKEGLERPRFKPGRTRAKVYKHIIYCVPTFANPSSRTMTLDRRKDLVRLAREFDALVVCDDVYDFLQWPADIPSAASRSDLVGRLEPYMSTRHLPRVVDVDRELDEGAEREGADGFGNVCSNGSFSKIAGPGLRVGWIEGTEKFAYGVSQTGTTCSGGAPSQLTSTYIHLTLAHNRLQGFIRSTLRPAYAARYRILMDAITIHLLPLGFSLPQTDRNIVGGYFTWLDLPTGMKAEVLAKRCKEEENVIIAPGKIFEVPGDESVKFEGSVRLCWSWEEEGRLEVGVRRVAVVAKRMLEVGERIGGEEFVVVEKEEEGDGVGEFK